jgi:hypothetical protein
MLFGFSARNRTAAFTLFATSLAMHAAAHATPPENPGLGSMDVNSFIGVRANEIFQRDMPQNTATVTVKWKTPGPTSTFSYYVVSLLDDTYTSRVRVLKEGSYSGNGLFTFALEPQTKDKKIRVSLYNSAMSEIARWDSPLFNVGEVFLVAGQSNAANHGNVDSTLNTTPDPKHRGVTPAVLNTTLPNPPSPASTWSTLQVQTPFATAWAAPNNGSPWLAFAKELSAKLAGVPVAVINVAVGGSPMEWWQRQDALGGKTFPNETYSYPRLLQGGQTVTRLNSSGGTMCSFRAVLWHQGEANAERSLTTTSPDGYGPADRKYYVWALDEAARDFRADTGCSQPWMVATVSWEDTQNYLQGQGSTTNKFKTEAEIRAAQRHLWSRAPVAGAPVFKAGPDTDMMNGEGPAYGQPGYRYAGDVNYPGLHMSSKGLAIHGKLWAWNVANMINSSLPINTLDPSLPADLFSGTTVNQTSAIPEVGKVWQKFRDAMGRNDTDILYDNEGLRYWVQSLVVNPNLDLTSIFAASDERYVRDTFQNTVGRRPAVWEAKYWVTRLAQQTTTRSALPTTANIGYENTLSANGKKVFGLYVNVMGRNLDDIKQDSGGMAYWTSVLDNNQATESAIADSFRASSEYRVRTAFVKSFNRQPTQTELNYYIANMGSRNDTDLAEYIWQQAKP